MNYEKYLKREVKKASKKVKFEPILDERRASKESLKALDDAIMSRVKENEDMQRRSQILAFT